MFVCWSAKGGSGTTVVAASLALVLSRSRPTVLVDLAGDVPAALGLAEPTGPGISDWLSSAAADAASLERLAVDAGDGLSIVHGGSDVTVAPARWSHLVEVLVATRWSVVIDAGLGPTPTPLHRDGSLLVTRPCFLSIRRATSIGGAPSAVVLVDEPGRALSRDDIERAVGAPVVARVPWDPAVARAVDAGLLRSRLPRSIAHPLATIARSPNVDVGVNLEPR
jgi:MinD-like ATPase involved in chromosome partitioning or flagellar assembly